MLETLLVPLEVFKDHTTNPLQGTLSRGGHWVEEGMQVATLFAVKASGGPKRHRNIIHFIR